VPLPPRCCQPLWWGGLLLIGSAAQAQLGASVALDSDYRSRGVSLSQGRPDARLSLAYDHPSGAYAGALLTRAELSAGRRSAQLLGYAGVVTRTRFGPSWEAGLSASHFGGDARYDYGEVFAGLLDERWSLRAYYSPDYFGFRQQTAYAEFDAHLALTPQMRLFGHAGALTVLHGHAADDASPGDPPRQRRTRVDLRAGVGFSVAAFDVQLAWVGVGRGGPYLAEYATRRAGWVLGAAVSF
jgi:uncharacterized protein (TIGR02001 family)